ncbi:MAG TPA: hypothetical protein VHM19_18390, partial [Polyangiales bacterium]|nr:hypothetical protein [Polyangiales bacterium]
VEHPTRWFVRRRLDVPLGDDALLLSDREPFSLNHLEQWQLGTELLGRARRGQSEDAWPVLRARGSLPIGTPGKLEYQEVGAKARALSEAGDRLRGGAKLPPRRFAITIGDVLLHGSLGELWLDAQVRVQYSKVGRRHELRQWLRHLVLCYLRAREKKSLLPRKSVLIGRNPDPKKEGVTRVTFAPVDGPERELSALVAMFLAGQDALVPLFEHASRAYCELLRKEGTTREEALEKARSKFSAAGHAFDRNVDFDTFDDYVSTAYAGWDAVLALREPYDFERAAKTVYAPMLAHRELV